MGTVEKYADFLQKNGRDNPCDKRPFEFPVWPQWLGASPEPYVVYLSFSDCVRALDLRHEMAPHSLKDEAAEEQIQFLKDNADEDGADFFLAAAYATVEKKKVKRSYAPTTQTHTLYSSDGKKAHGTKRELVALTGLTSRRVNDLVSWRRDYASGWALTAERAAEGPRRGGRPRKTEA